MALSVAARRALMHGLASNACGDEIADLIDTGSSGTLSAAARQRMDFAVVNRQVSDGICDAIDAGTALSAQGSQALGIAICSRVFAAEIAAALAL